MRGGSGRGFDLVRGRRRSGLGSKSSEEVDGKVEDEEYRHMKGTKNEGKKTRHALK
jgi:hypothetical protein